MIFIRKARSVRVGCRLSASRIVAGLTLGLSPFAAGAAHAQAQSDPAQPAANAPAQPNSSATEAQVQTRNQAQTSNGDADASGTITVTARRVAESLQNVPLSVSAFGGQNLQDREANQLVDVARYTPGVQFTQGTATGFTAFLQSRGQTQASSIQTFEPAFSVYMNQVYTGATTGLAGLGILDIDRVEILRGPQGTLYGRNSTGGAISVYTRQPTYDTSAEISATVGSRNLYSGWGVVNFPIANDVAAMRIVVGTSTQDGFAYDVHNGRHVRGLESGMVRATLRLDPAPNVNISLVGEVQRGHSSGQDWHILGALPTSVTATEIAIQAGYITTADAANFRAGLLPNAVAQVQALIASRQPGVGGDRDTVSLTDVNPAIYRSSFVGNVITWNLGHVTLKSISGYRAVAELNDAIDFDGTEFNVLDSRTSNPAFIAFYNGLRQGGSNTEFRLLTQDFNASGQIGPVQFTGGLFMHDSKQHDWSTTTITPNLNPNGNPSIIDFDSTSRSVAGYGQVTWNILDNLRATGGLRYTDEHKSVTARTRTRFVCNVPPPATLADCEATFRYSDSNWSYSAGLDWHPTQDVMLYVKRDRGYRSGGINGRTSNDPVSVIPFQAEVVNAWEAGIRSEFLQHRLTFNLAAYHNAYGNIQQSVVIAGLTGAPTTVVQNAARARIQGIELEVTARPFQGMELGGTLTHTDPKYLEYIDPRSGADLSNTEFKDLTKWDYTLFGQYTVPLGSVGRLRFGADWVWRGRANLAPQGAYPTTLDVVPGYGLLDARIVFETHDQLEVRLWTQNLLNQRSLTYIQSIASLGSAVGGYNEPRSIGITLTKRF